MAREQTSYDAKIQERAPFDQHALLQGGSDIEALPPGADFEKLIKDEAFMNEPVQIRFLPSSDPNAPKLIEIGVNTSGRTGPMGAPTDDYPEGKPGVAARGGKSVKKGFSRGQVYTVPRYFLEVIAHSKTQVLEQSSESSNPFQIMQRLRDCFTYPFEVVEDKNPKGRMWLERVMADSA